MKKNNFFVKFYRNTHLWIIFTCIGVWILVFQNFITSTDDAKNVYVVGGELEAEVSGSVYVPNMVDVNLQGINGHTNCFYNNSYYHPNDYYRIPIIDK